MRPEVKLVNLLNTKIELVERKKDKICVIEDISDLWAIEKSNAFNGQYHILGGVLSAIDGIGPEELNIISLFFLG